MGQHGPDGGSDGLTALLGMVNRLEAVVTVWNVDHFDGRFASPGGGQEFCDCRRDALLPDLAAQGLAAAGSPPSSPPAWPDITEQRDEAELTELIVQINGKKRGSVRVPRDAGEELVLASIRADESLNTYLGDRPVHKAIVVRNRLVNLVV